MNYSQFELLSKRSIFNKFKSLKVVENLKFLDNDLNYKLLVSIIGGNIKKLKPTIMQHKVGNKIVQNNYEYGHIKIGWNSIRLSTCLDIKNNKISIPIEEAAQFIRGDLIFFTCGDLYLIIDCKKLYNKIESKSIIIEKNKLKNYDIFIPHLFDANIVSHYGLIDMNTLDVETNNTIINLSQVILPNFNNQKLKGCLTGLKPKYLLARIENSDSIDFFETISCATLNDVKNLFSITGPKTVQGIGRKIKINTENILNEKIGNESSILKLGKDNSYIPINVQKIIDIERVQKYCQQFLKSKENNKEYSIHWAVKHSKFCRSQEEYQYYKKLFIECNGIKNKYNLEEINFFKECYQCESFKYKKNINYNYYS